MSAQSSPSTLLQSMLDIFIAPSQAFARLNQTGAHAWILLLQIIVVTAVFYWFYAGMSPQWLIEQQVLMAGDLSPAETEQMRSAMAQTAEYMAIIGSVSVALMTLVITAITAGYLHLVTRLSGDFAYQDWFGFTVWSQMPLLLNSAGLLVITLLATSADLPLSTPSFASLNQLLLQLPLNHAFYTWAETLNMFYLWQIVLVTLGLKQWCQFSTGKALLLASLPTLLIYGIWAAVI